MAYSPVMTRVLVVVVSLLLSVGLLAPPATAEEPSAPAVTCEEWQVRAVQAEADVEALEHLVGWYDGQWSKLRAEYRAEVVALDAQLRRKQRTIRRLRATIRGLRG